MSTLPVVPRGPIRAALGYVDACLQRGEMWIAYAAIRRAIKLPYGATFRSAVLGSSHWKDALAARGLTVQPRGKNLRGIGLSSDCSKHKVATDTIVS